jgi:integrase
VTPAGAAARSTVKLQLILIRKACAEELISRNVAKLVRVPSPRYKIGKSLSVDEVRRLLAAASGHRLYPLYVVAATMGLRCGGLLGICFCRPAG